MSPKTRHAVLFAGMCALLGAALVLSIATKDCGAGDVSRSPSDLVGSVSANPMGDPIGAIETDLLRAGVDLSPGLPFTEIYGRGMQAVRSSSFRLRRSDLSLPTELQ